MSSGLAILSADGPTVLVKPDITLTHRYHRLYGDTHRGLQHHTVASAAVVGHLWVFVHLTTDAMTGQLTNDTVFLCLTVALHRIADITKMSSCLGCLDTEVKGFLRGLEQLLYIIGHLSHTEGIGRVAIESIKQCTAVNGDDISLL